MTYKAIKASEEDSIAGWTYNVQFMKSIADVCEENPQLEVIDEILDVLYKRGLLKLEEQEQEQENISSWSALTNLDYLRCNNVTGDISSWPAFVIDAVQRAISESIIEYISQHPTEQPSNTRELSAEEIDNAYHKFVGEWSISLTRKRIWNQAIKWYKSQLNRKNGKQDIQSD